MSNASVRRLLAATQVQAGFDEAEAEEARSTPHQFRAAPVASESRALDRRSLYAGEGLTLNLTFGAGEATGEVIDMTPEGLGIAVLGPQPRPAVGETVVLEHTGPATCGIRQNAVVRSVSDKRIAGQPACRIGLSIVADRTPPGSTVDRRRGDRHACPEHLPALASAQCPLFFREWLHFGITQIGARGMTLKTSLRNKGLLRGLELDFTVTLPISGSHQVRGRITSVRREGRRREFVVGIAWLDASHELVKAAAEYLLLGDKTLTPALLRQSGLHVGSIERAVTYDYAKGARDREQILKLRLHAHQAEGRFQNLTLADMASPADAHSRHITCRFGRRIVGYLRVNYVNGDRARSQYVTEGGHDVPQWLWEAGFVEGGAAAIDPDFQGAGLYTPLLQHWMRVAMQSGFRYVLAAVGDKLLPMYQQLGFEVLETRTVEPKPGWRFDSHLILIDMGKIADDAASGKADGPMERVASFVVKPPALPDPE